MELQETFIENQEIKTQPKNFPSHIIDLCRIKEKTSTSNKFLGILHTGLDDVLHDALLEEGLEECAKHFRDSRHSGHMDGYYCSLVDDILGKRFERSFANHNWNKIYKEIDDYHRKRTPGSHQ